MVTKSFKQCMFSGEKKELSPSDIKNVGNWSQEVFEQAYYAQLPMKPLRVMAGHGEGKWCVEIARDISVPINSRTIVFLLIEKAKLQISGSNKITANFFLNFMDNLRDIIIQDAAAMICMGRNNAGGIFAVAVFKTDEFWNFVASMKKHLSTFVSIKDVSMETVKLGINPRFDML